MELLRIARSNRRLVFIRFELKREGVRIPSKGED